MYFKWGTSKSQSSTVVKQSSNCASWCYYKSLHRSCGSEIDAFNVDKLVLLSCTLLEQNYYQFVFFEILYYKLNNCIWN